nr:hypothetical protein HUO10_004460 [Paraburkholderia busanensis]
MVEEVDVGAVKTVEAEQSSAFGAVEKASFESLEPRYLEALAEEGIDLDTFLVNWRHAMEDDIAQLSALCRDGETERLRGLLHRLSGAVGLVGACSLMEALRYFSANPYAHDHGAIDMLTARARTLIMQLETTPPALGNTLR